MRSAAANWIRKISTKTASGVVNTDGYHSYYWDAENENVKLDASLTMTYDALGRWVEKTEGSELAIMNGANLVTAYLGTPRLYSGASRSTPLNDMAFAPFGEQYQGPTSADTFFTGAGQNVEAGDLRTFPARNYAPLQGRWTAPDPAGLSAVDLSNPQTWNRYAYVMNDPLNSTDPTGLCTSPDGSVCFDSSSVPACKWWQIWCWGGGNGPAPISSDPGTTFVPGPITGGWL